MKQGLVAVGSGMILLSVFGIFLFRKPKTLGQEAEALARCIVSRDSECVWDYLSHEEKTQLGLSKESLKKLLSEYALNSVTRASEIREVLTKSESPHSISVTFSVTDGSGKSQEFMVPMSKKDKGVESRQLLCFLILREANDRYYGGHLHRGKIARAYSWLEQAEKDGPKLLAMGIPGIYRGNPGEPLLRWDVWAEINRERIRKAPNQGNGQTQVR
jgi:hypothetical protein